MDGKSVFEAQQKEQAEQMEKQRQLQAQQAAETAARRSAESKESGGGVAPAWETANPAESAAKPRTTVRKALQRKAKPKRPEEYAAPAETAVATGPTSEPTSLPEAEEVPSDEQNSSGD